MVQSVRTRRNYLKFTKWGGQTEWNFGFRHVRLSLCSSGGLAHSPDSNRLITEKKRTLQIAHVQSSHSDLSTGPMHNKLLLKRMV